ncbi:AidA/PixA family protein [Trinickia caryophylli]|uniref:AidA/PixA family protein n=1 Tax=Trinickia caryophylli TaxID=28094 RepID=UPI0014783A86|nr:AidA/PixA family protein [Trinickia caryophylli]
MLIVVDALNIVRNFPRNNGGRGQNPYVSLGEASSLNYLYMLAPRVDVISDEGDAGIDIRAKAGDIIRWRMTTMSEGTGFSCFMTHFVFTSDPYNSLTPPEQKYRTVTTLQIDKNAPMLKGVAPITRDDFYWESTVKNAGRVVYHGEFLLFAPSDDCDGGGTGGTGDPYGGFQWDPAVN